ncbi:MAG: penicillin-binding transpeptidase domain-containing protein [Clostridium sp.]
MKKRVISLMLIGSLLLTGCATGKENIESDNKENSNEIVEPNKEENQGGNVAESIKPTEPIINNIDFTENFKGIKGGAIFYTPNSNKYDVYNEEVLDEEISPYSTFKIISTLMGLEKGVITSKNTKLGYDGKKYSNEAWNKDVTLEEAFQSSCVWYFEKLVASLDKSYVQEVLNNLGYGNKDLSAWNNNGHNTFWISSSLKISPREQIEVLRKIFEGESTFKKENIDLLKEIMYVDGDSIFSIYGKTGSAKDTNSWFVGIVEVNFEKTYFAIRLKDENIKLGGNKAKEIGIEIIKEYFVY